MPLTSSSQPKDSQTSWAGVCPASSSDSTASQIGGDAALVVERPAAPDRRAGGGVVDLAAERVVLPRGLGVDGHDVEVRHQHDRALGARPGPVEEQAVGADTRELQPLVQQRELRRELGQQPVEGVGVDARGVAVGDGRDADERLQSGDHAVGHGQTVVPHRPRWTRFVRRSRRAGEPGAPASVSRWPTVIAPTGAWSSGMPNASRNAVEVAFLGCRRSRRPAPRRRRSAGRAAPPSPRRPTSRGPASVPRRGRSSPCRAGRSGRGRRPCWSAGRSRPGPCACRRATRCGRRGRHPSSPRSARRPRGCPGPGTPTPG